MAIEEIADEDLLYQYIIQRRGDSGHAAYFRGGLQNANQVAAEARRILKREPLNVLEFASGYGRVSRHLQTTMPETKIAASDIHPQACAFLRDRLGITAFESATDPDDLSIEEKFEFIFVLSLFSHLPDRTFRRWLGALYSLLAPGGALLFTTHGQTSLSRFEGIDLANEETGEGWIYRRKSDQPDLDVEDYGTMIVTPRYVVDAIEECGDAVLASFSAGNWLSHQDAWVLRRPS